MDAGQSNAVESGGSYYAEPDSALEPWQYEHEQHQRSIRSSDGARENFTPPKRLCIDNTNVKRGIRSSNLTLPERLGIDNTNAERGTRSSNFTPPKVLGIDNTNVEHGIFSSNFTPPERLGIDNTNVERGIPSSQNLSQFQSSISMPSPVGAFRAVVDSSGLCVSEHTSIRGPSPFAVDTLLQHPSAVQLTHPWGPSHLPSSTKLNIPVAQPSQSSNQRIPESIRKRSRNNNKETIRCKNCKRTKCLKLNCGCFSSGFYCADDSCSCLNCLNKTDFEDTVEDIRNQILIRDPHAFAPKVVVEQAENTMVQLNQAMPSIARHRTGCNCKNSKCAKEYCKCYQAKVGCAQGCRCYNCQNYFGTKAGPRTW